jgi:hypothetical protein
MRLSDVTERGTAIHAASGLLLDLPVTAGTVEFIPVRDTQRGIDRERQYSFKF